MEPILGNGLVTSENAFHKRQRKLIPPAFPHRQLTSLAPLMAQSTEHLQSQWQAGEVIALAQQMMPLPPWPSSRRDPFSSSPTPPPTLRPTPPTPSP